MDPKSMFKIGYGLYVLTANSNGKDNGCIINTAIQVTSQPNRISICLNKLNYTHDMIVKDGKFNISVIDETASFDLFKHFGFASGKDKDKFADFDSYKKSENGLLYICENTNAFISGKVFETVDLGTHTMFLADVTDGEVLSDNKTCTYDYYQSNIKPKPEKKKVKGYRCRICGYVYEGEELPEDFVCPICKHGASDFEKITD
jgi:flavin reductase (DIM6/NTAB) family NADH-FMN oxidoreductase RutF